MALILILILLLVLAGGGGFYGHRRYGRRGLVGVLVLILVILLVMWLVGLLIPGPVYHPPALPEPIVPPTGGQ